MGKTRIAYGKWLYPRSGEASPLEGTNSKDGFGMQVAAVFATLFTYGNELV